MILCAEITKDNTNKDDPQYFLTVKSVRLQKSWKVNLNQIPDPEQRKIFLSWAEETWEAI